MAEAAEAQAATEGAEEAAAGQEGQQEGAGAQPDAVERLSQRFDEFAEGMPNMIREHAAPAAAEGEGAQEFEAPPEVPVDPMTGEPDYSQMEPEAAQQAAQAQLDQYVDTRVQDAIGQALEPLHNREVARELAGLEDQYPQLRDEKYASGIVDKVKGMAAERGIPAMAKDPEMIELVHLAESARKRAASEAPADGEGEVELEGAGGAARQEAQPDQAQAIADARPRDGFWT